MTPAIELYCNAIVIAGVVVAVATVPEKPLAETTDAVVTVPNPAAVHDGFAAAPPVVRTFPFVPAGRFTHLVALR